MTMNAILQVQFQRVESALNTLIDSISTYTPSPAAALALLEADDELSRGLEQLSTHQSNYATLTRLHETTESLSDQITQILTQLDNTRAELLETPATIFPEDSRDVPYEDLLTYAKRISKFTVPPTFRAPQPPAEAPSTQDQQASSPEKEATSPAEQVENGDDVAMKDSDVMVNGTAASPENAQTKKGVAIASLPPQETQWLDPASSTTFSPWPTEETIRRGALAQIQMMLESGQDPATVKDVALAGPDSAGGQEDVKPSMGQAHAQEDIQRRDVATGLAPASEAAVRGAVARAEAEAGVGDDKANNGTEAAKESSKEEGANVVQDQAQNREQETATREKVEEKPAVFGGLDLYDPDDE